ncbi:MAG: endonuclease/exonuclease/phosphatase family protein [Gemmatimonadota bacterium]
MNGVQRLRHRAGLRGGPTAFLTSASGRGWSWIALAGLVLQLAGCRTGVNYASAAGPRYAGAAASRQAPSATGSDSLRLVSFNIAFAENVDSAIALLTTDPALRGADVVLLQEMDEPGTRRIAEALGSAYVYYPAIYSLHTKRDFGNAILSKWPIIDDAKLILPKRAFLKGTQRIATAATIRVHDTDIRVYSTHLATWLEGGPGTRRDQLAAILDDAAGHARVVVGGDMNSHGVGRLAAARGYLWPTRNGPRTSALGRWDHLFQRGLTQPPGEVAGTVLDVMHASDHRPVWAVVLIR